MISKSNNSIKIFKFTKMSIAFILILSIINGCSPLESVLQKETDVSSDVAPEEEMEKNASREAELRKFPYPFNAMLAISTDIDATAFHDFEATHRYINTLEDTEMGKGLGLDIANSFWMYVNTDKKGFIDNRESTTWDEQMSYFRTDWTEPFLKDQIQKYIEAGWIDTIHSFGDFSMNDRESTGFERAHAKKAIAELEKQNIAISVWTNHGNQSNIQNFGGDYSFTEYQQGDIIQAEGYHTDLTVPYGIEFLWDSNGNSEMGHPSVLYPIELQDGQEIWGFKRFTHLMEDNEMNWLWGVHSLDDQLSEDHLDQIVFRQHYSVISQHLGNLIEDEALPEQAIEGLTRLRDYQDDEKILVARTSRLLEYNRNHDHLVYKTKINDDHKEIHITKVDDPVFGAFVPDLEQIRGFTFYVKQPENTSIFINNEPIPDKKLSVNQADHCKPSLSIKWFEPDYTDYTKK